MKITLSRAHADELIAHAREAAPHEACGVAGVRDGRVVRVARARNAAATPQVRFAFDDDGYRRIIAVEREGLEPALYHSHPVSPAYPSATDRAEMSATWPDTLQLMVSLRHGPDQPELNAYRIDHEGNVTREDLVIAD